MSDSDSPIERRSVLRSIGAATTLGALGAGPTASARTSDSAALTEPLGTVQIEGTTNEAVTGDDGTVAYVSRDTGFATVDISDPSNPTVLANLGDTGISGILDAKVDGDRLFLAGRRDIGLYDISDPANPTQLDAFNNGFGIHNCFLDDGIAFAINDPEAEIVMYDVSNDEFEEIGRYKPSDLGDNPLLHDLWVQDDVMYMAYWNDGTPMVDISDPADPELIGKVRDGSDKFPNNDHYVQVNEDASIIIIGKEAFGDGLGVEIWDISDPTDTSFFAEIDPPSEGGTRTSHNCDIVGDYLYSSWYGGGVRVHDISDPANPEEIYWWRQNNVSFWTAKVGVVGESFIANDYANTELYVFPDPREDGGDNEAPSAAFDASPTDPSVGETVSVDAGASSDPDGSITSYEWDFGDGETATGETATHAYESTGEYTVALTVTDDDGATDSASELITVVDDGGECGAESESTTESGFLAWWNGDAVHTYATKTSDPCGVTVELEGPGFANFDLYVTYDGRTPTREDYDDRSAGAGSSESITGDLSGATDVGILVDGVDGWGEYSVTIGEDGR
ncbi:PKD domain-containing protein [Halovivax limisalsi]|uniref:PKD domain-containing protein n=1 Tax=Halovivax limisalsi TaxID=1453760 RepID=UPI001FFD4C21|nr:PKD domain-containing protein [Halovivax limisalsi]